MSQTFSTNPQQRCETCAVNGCEGRPEAWVAVQGRFNHLYQMLLFNCWVCAAHYNELNTPIGGASTE